MKKSFKFALVLAAAALAFVGCKKDNNGSENNETGTTDSPVVSVAADASFTDGKATITVTLSPANPDKATKVTLALDEASTIPAGNLSVPASITVKKGETTNTGEVTFNAGSLEAGEYTAVIKATEASNGATIGSKSTVTIKAVVEPGEDPGPDDPKPGPDDPTPTSKIKVIDFSNAYNSVWTVFDKNVDLSSGYTMIVHVYVDQFNSNTYLGKLSDNTPQGANTNNILRFGEQSGRTSQLEWSVNQNGRIYSSTDFEVKTWYSIAVTTDASGNRYLYINGEEEANGTHPGIASQKFGAIEWGDSWGTSGGDARPFPGSICMISVWDTALSAEQVKALVKTAPEKGAANLVAYWPMTDGSGYVCAEESGAGNFGAIDFSKNWVEYGSGSVADCATSIADSWRELEF